MEAHALALEQGGLRGVIDQGRIEAAIGRPYVGYFRPIHAKAAALFEAIIANHGFADGNKRTAVLLASAMLRKSGYILRRAHAGENVDLAMEELAVSVARGELELQQIVTWFELRTKRQRR